MLLKYVSNAHQVCIYLNSKKDKPFRRLAFICNGNLATLYMYLLSRLVNFIVSLLNKIIISLKKTAFEW